MYRTDLTVGTGKSFIGALAAKLIHKYTEHVILVLCFTNHALDQFLEDLMDIGIPQDCMVRLGGKSTARTDSITLRGLSRQAKYKHQHWAQINHAEDLITAEEYKLKSLTKRYQNRMTSHELLRFLSFEGAPYCDCFVVPKTSNGEIRIGKKGKKLSSDYLLDRWRKGEKDAGALKIEQGKEFEEVWRMPTTERQTLAKGWEDTYFRGIIEDIGDSVRRIDELQKSISGLLDLASTHIIKQKRIIACTTNGASKYAEAIQSASPNIVIVEEAGEILEAHILTCMGPNTQQLILIGDHKQLKPKCEHTLSVQGGRGYDLNCSLFERLVLKGFPHVTLRQQFRMRPAISASIRHLTYPDLEDAPSTLTRLNLRGFSDNVIWMDHNELEIALAITFKTCCMAQYKS